MSIVRDSFSLEKFHGLIRLALAILVLLGSLESASGSTFYLISKQPRTTVSSPPVTLQEGTAGTSTIYTNSTSAKVSVSVSGDESLGSVVQVSSSARTSATAYVTQIKVLRTTDANNTIHVFFIDISGYIRWYRSTDNGQTFSLAFVPTQLAESLSVTKDDANNIHLVYEYSGNIYYRKQAYDATGWGTEKTLDSAGKDHFPSIAIALYNNSWIYVVYDYHTDAPPKKNKWYFTSSTDGGSTWSTPVDNTLNEFTAGLTAGTFPSIVIHNTLDTYGHVYVTWFSGDTCLYLRRGVIGSAGAVTWDSGSSTISSGMSTATTTVNTNMMHSAVYVNGKYRVVYCESGTAKYRDWDETTWSTPIALATVSNHPSLTYNDNNYLYVFYQTDAANANYDTRYQKSTDTTPTGFGSAINVTSDNTGNHYVNAKVGGDNSRLEFIWTQGTSIPFNVKYNYITFAGGEGDFDHVLKVVNQVSDPWEIRLKAYDQSNIGRLNNCTIYLHNGGNLSQIIIISGEYTQQVGDWYDLVGSGADGTDFIAMHIEATVGTSYIYVYLEILIPSTSTYARYIITFEIT